MFSVKLRSNVGLSNQIAPLLLKFCIALGIFSMTMDAYAVDLLAGTTRDVVDTMKGAGKHWAIIVDGAVSLGAFAMTKKPTVFFSVLAISVAITVMLKLVGG